jgi:hypothetical protein
VCGGGAVQSFLSAFWPFSEVVRLLVGYVPNKKLAKAQFHCSIQIYTHH